MKREDWVTGEVPSSISMRCSGRCGRAIRLSNRASGLEAVQQGMLSLPSPPWVGASTNVTSIPRPFISFSRARAAGLCSPCALMMNPLGTIPVTQRWGPVAGPFCCAKNLTENSREMLGLAVSCIAKTSRCASEGLQALCYFDSFFLLNFSYRVPHSDFCKDFIELCHHRSRVDLIGNDAV